MRKPLSYRKSCTLRFQLQLSAAAQQTSRMTTSNDLKWKKEAKQGMTAFTLHEKGFVMSPLRSFPSLLRFSALMYKEGGGVVVVVVVVGYASVLSLFLHTYNHLMYKRKTLNILASFETIQIIDRIIQ